MTSQKEEYWNTFYSSDTRAAPDIPSQFAAFAANEANGMTGLLEFGCGNGRDSEFFGHLGYDVLAVDVSTGAIEVCQKKSRHDNVAYQCADASQSVQVLSDFAKKHQQFCVYGRFFLHAITEDEQAHLFAAFAEALPQGSLLAFEYRTTKDADDTKAFGDHYRRFLDHAGFTADLQAGGYDVLYQIEGQGFAKYKSEDAFVGRIIARRR